MAPLETLTSLPVLPSAVALPALRVPPRIDRPPVKVLLPLSVSVPTPDIVSPKLPPPGPSCKVPAKVLAAELLTVRFAAAALPFWTTGVPTMALVVRPLMVTLLPLRLKVPLLLELKATELGELELRAPGLPTCSVPPLIVTPPVKVLFPARRSVPAPTLVSAKFPPMASFN